MKRPTGFTLLSFLFVWLSVAGFGFAWAAMRTDPAQLATFHFHIPVLVGIGIIYGIAASATALALWRVAIWAPRAILIWGASLFLGMIALQTMIGVAGEPWWLVLLPYVVFGALIGALFRYVDRRSQSVVQAI